MRRSNKRVKGEELESEDAKVEESKSDSAAPIHALRRSRRSKKGEEVTTTTTVANVTKDESTTLTKEEVSTKKEEKAIDEKPASSSAKQEDDRKEAKSAEEIEKKTTKKETKKKKGPVKKRKRSKLTLGLNTDKKKTRDEQIKARLAQQFRERDDDDTWPPQAIPDIERTIDDAFFAIEYAPSNRSSCRQCQKKIDEKALRWCVTAVHDMNPNIQYDDIADTDTLKESDQEQLQKEFSENAFS